MPFFTVMFSSQGVKILISKTKRYRMKIILASQGGSCHHKDAIFGTSSLDDIDTKEQEYTERNAYTH